jgi:hypothetical protein
MTRRSPDEKIREGRVVVSEDAAARILQRATAAPVCSSEGS